MGEAEQTQSREYEQFKKENEAVTRTLYERVAALSGTIVQVSAGKNEKRIQGWLDTAHLSCKPGDVLSLTLLGPLVVFIVSIVLTVALPLVFTGSVSLWFLVFSMIMALMAYVPLSAAPRLIARKWRQEASNQMVLCVFYMVTYMRHTPNLEHAIEFAADHIGAPLSDDLKKVLWDVETQRFENVSESLEHYLEDWREDAREFIEAVHLIQASLYETSNDRRISSLDKALEVILDETYEKMLHYAQNLKSPMTMLHMLGIILPILGLVILPLAVSFFETHWTFIASLYNIILPLSVYYLGKRILMDRPTGYGGADTVQAHPLSGKRSLSPAMEAGIIAAVLIVIGLSPVILHTLAPTFELYFGPHQFLGYVQSDGAQKGPFGLGAGVVSLLVTLGAGLSLAWFYRRRTKSLIGIRERTRQLESEFASALFQLGNRIGDGVPGEIAFGKVAATMEGTTAGQFFAITSNNVTQLGMGVNDALFDEKRGSVRQFPSNLIESSMKVFVESSRKGPIEASKALMSMSTYIKEMHRVDERLKDLLSDVIGSMKSQINFLLPTIAGIVIGITSMITAVLGAINKQAEQFSQGGVVAGLPSDMFGLGIPTFYFQIVVGLYVVQVTWILAYLISGVENGVDPLSEEWVKGKSLMVSTTLYCVIALIIIIIFNVIAGQIMTSL